MARKNGKLWVKAYIKGRESMQKEMEQQNKGKGGCLSVVILMMSFGGLLSLIIKIL